MKHQVLIPLEVNTDPIEQRLEKDAYDDLISRLFERMEKELPSHYSYGYKEEKNWKRFVESAANSFFEQYKDEMIEAAADKLAAKMIRTKACREAIAEVIQNS